LIENRFRDWYGSKWTRPLILAHRGDSFHAPENTLEAARLGLDSDTGADGWEMDVRLTGDGIPIVFHDESLARTTDVARVFEGDPRGSRGFLVADFSMAEIARLDAGSWFVDPAGGPRSASGFGTLDGLAGFDRALYSSGKVRVPTLAEALALTSRLDRLVNVEIKPGAEGVDKAALVDAVIGEVGASRTLGLAAISSFDLEIVAMVARRGTGVATGALVEGLLERPAADLLRSIGADALHAPPSVVDSATLGVPVLVYTVNDAGPLGLAFRLAGAGVAGLFSDDPASLAMRFGINRTSRRTRSR
jgi:glycerophosphoryl diester phosphodiesterase